MDNSGVRALYLHVPFCEHKCAYCDFVSVAGNDHERRYIEALNREISMLALAFPGAELDTVFVGGGTPGFVDPALLHGVLDTVRRCFRLAAGAEITLEANPSSTTEDRATAWLEAGFNRVSLGVQSLYGDILAFLDRVHDAERAVDAVHEVRRAGFAAINCDLMYAVPGLDDARWADTVDRMLALDPGHLSAYELTVETGTALHVAVRRGRIHPVDGEAALRQHWIVADRARAARYEQYEVSDFSQPGRECRHNLVYWKNGLYLAAGVGAHGHVPPDEAATLGFDVADGAAAVRYWHGRSLPRYLEMSESGALPVTGHESVAPADATAERVMLGLRLREGVSLPRGSEKAAQRLADGGLLVLDGGRATATRRGEEVLNSLAAELTAESLA